MANAKHPDSDLIDKLGGKVVSRHFGLTPQHLYNWRTRGVPLSKRMAVAKLCTERCIELPNGFFTKLRELGLAA